MADVQKELQKIKALINQKQTTAIFSNKSNESTKLALGDTELYINDMTRKFSFTKAGVKNPISIDPKTKSISNVEYINDVRMEDISGVVGDIDKLQEDVERHTVQIGEIENELSEHAKEIKEHNHTSITSEDGTSSVHIKSNTDEIGLVFERAAEELSSIKTCQGSGNLYLTAHNDGDVIVNSDLTCVYPVTCLDTFKAPNIYNKSEVDELISEISAPIYHTYNVDVKQIFGSEGEHGVLNIAFHTDGMHNDDLNCCLLFMTAEYTLEDGAKGPYEYKLKIVVPHTMTIG